MKQNRREFLRTIGLLYGSVLFLPSCLPGNSEYRVFNSSEADCLISLCEQIIPADHDPGATDAGVIHFIDKLLYERFPELLSIYQQGIAGLNASCNELFQCPFTSLTIERQIEIMKLMEANQLPEKHWQVIKPAAFFNQVIQNTMQGFYGSPRHGGNKNYMSYRMLKLDFPLVVGQNRYNNA